MTTDKHSPDPRFFNEDGSINYDEALAAGRAARAGAIREIARAGQPSGEPSLAGRLLSVLRPTRQTS